MIPRVLVIAGSDSGAGAGIQADVKTVMALGGYATTAITAVTVQDTRGVRDVFVLPTDLVERQVLAVVDDIGVDAIKLGMLGSEQTVHGMLDLIAYSLPGVPVVVDPVMFATSGDALNERGTAAAIPRLLDHATVVTPNLSELAALGGLSVADEEGMLEAAERLVQRHGCAVLATGGHLAGATVVDLLVDQDRTVTRWSDSRIETRHSHGTGCTLASGIAVGLAKGLPLEAAIAEARRFVRHALSHPPGIGVGRGPLGHGAARD